MVITTNKLDIRKIESVVFKDIDVLLSNLDLKYTCLRDNIFMCCPIHEGSNNTNGLSISLKKKIWRCWTRNCHEATSNDIVGFTQGVLDYPFIDALQFICNAYDIDFNDRIEVEEPEPEDEFTSLVKIFKKKKILTTGGFVKASTCGSSPYFVSRGFEPETLAYFGVEDCIDRDSGLFNRAVIPVHNENGVEVGYIARATKDYLLPKFRFSGGFLSGNHLYNYHKARDAALSKTCLIMVEGQGDVWRFYEAGVHNCVGLFGKDISPQQKRVIENYGVTKLVIITDPDQPGREAKLKALRFFFRTFTLHFPKITKKDVGDMTVKEIKDNILPQIKGLYL